MSHRRSLSDLVQVVSELKRNKTIRGRSYGSLLKFKRPFFRHRRLVEKMCNEGREDGESKKGEGGGKCSS